MIKFKDVGRVLKNLINKIKGGYKMIYNYQIREFTNYSLCYYANNKEKKSNDCIAKINCYSEGQEIERLYDGTVLSPVLEVKFFKNDSLIPPNKIVWYGNNGNSGKLREKYGSVWKMNLHYPLSQFNNIISILRYEKKPLYLFLDEDSLKGGISTTVELISKEKKE